MFMSYAQVRKIAVVAVAAVVCVSTALAARQDTPTLIGVVGPIYQGPTHMALDSAGTIYWRDGLGAWSAVAHCPPGHPVLLQAHSGDAYLVAMENGDIYTFPAYWEMPSMPPFTYLGNPLSAAVGVGPASWSQLKTHYTGK